MENEIKELLKHEGFKIALKKLALKINEIDTVRNLEDTNIQEAGLKAISRKMAIEKIEEWLDELFGIAEEFRNIAFDQADQEDNIIKRIEKYK